MRRTWRNRFGTPCWGEDYKSAQEVSALTDEQIKSTIKTGVALSRDKQHVICWYVQESGDALYIESNYPAKVVARMADSGETMDLRQADETGRLYGAGYIIPGPIVSYGKIVYPAGSVHVPASMTAGTIWTGSGYIYDPDR